MKLIPTAAIAILLAISLASAQKVKVDVDTTFNFANFKTFGWHEGQISPNPMISEMIRSDIERALIARGLTRTSDKPDLSIAVMAALDMDLAGVGPTWNNAVWKSWGSYGNPAALMNVANGTLLIDLLENNNNFSVFRGVAKTALNHPTTGDLAKDAKSVQKHISKSVDKIFAKYPTSPK